MSEWTENDRRIGIASAIAAAAIGALYDAIGVAGLFVFPHPGASLRQVDPYLAILESLIIAFAVVLVVVLAAVHQYAPAGRKTWSLAALAFSACFSALTCSVHFASLTVGRQMDPASMPALAHQLPVNEDWPTVAMACDFLAWDFFLGLALLLAAQSFARPSDRQARIALTVAGTLCLAGAAGPLSGHMAFQFPGIAGYAFALPVACAMLARAWRAPQANS
jgi:hypothetical protein